MVQQPGDRFSHQFQCVKLMACLSISILAKKSSTKLFRITQIKDESTRVYLKRFDEEMFKVEDLIKLIASEALISG